MEQFNVQVSSSDLPKWRWVYPNWGQLTGFPQLGNVVIRATNGLEALFEIDESGTLWRGHLSAFNGPVAKVYVAEEDWDYEKKRRKVNVFRRADGSIVVIPQDSFMDDYWKVHVRLSPNEKECYDRLGCGDMRVVDFDESLRMLNEATAQAVAQRRTKPSKRRQLLESL